MSKQYDILLKILLRSYGSLFDNFTKIQENIISIGISLESQIESLKNFISSQGKKKTIIMYPKNDYTSFIDNKLSEISLNNYKIFKYESDPKLLTGDIEKLTNYSQRKRNFGR